MNLMKKQETEDEKSNIQPQDKTGNTYDGEVA